MSKQTKSNIGIERKYCAVPYNQKDDFINAATQSGLLTGYDGKQKVWYVEVYPRTDISNISRWIEPLATSETADQTTIITAFSRHLENIGLRLDRSPAVMDGVLHRVPVEDGKAGSRDGAYIGFLDGHPAGWGQNFKTGVKEKWKFGGRISHTQDIADMRKKSAQKRKDREEEKEYNQKIALAKLAAFFAQSETGKANHHPYLKKKGLSRCDPAIVVDDGRKLVIPIVDITGRLKSGQTITTQGTKRYIANTSKKGCFFVAAPERKEFSTFWQDAEKVPYIFVCEGYTTGLTISKAVNNYVVIAFDAGNYEPVVEAIQNRFQKAQLVICADNDVLLKEGNKGVLLAKKAAALVNGIVVIPHLPSEFHGTDYNDLFCGIGGGEKGLTSVRQQIQRSIQKTKEIIM